MTEDAAADRPLAGQACPERQPPPPPPTGFTARVADRIASLAPNDIFAPLFGLYDGMGAHETHLAREMKLAGQTAVVDPDPYLSRMDGANSVDYAAIVLCPGLVKYEGRIIERYDPPTGRCRAKPSVISRTRCCQKAAPARRKGTPRRSRT